MCQRGTGGLVVGVVSIMAICGCGGKMPWEKETKKGAPPPVVQIKSIPCKLACVAGKITLDCIAEGALAYGIDAKAVLRTILDGDLNQGYPPKDVPVLVVINKKENDLRYWKLTDNIATVKLKSKNSPEVGVNIRNRSDTAPLTIEVWYDSDREIEMVFEMKESKTTE